MKTHLIPALIVTFVLSTIALASSQSSIAQESEPPPFPESTDELFDLDQELEKSKQGKWERGDRGDTEPPEMPIESIEPFSSAEEFEGVADPIFSEDNIDSQATETGVSLTNNGPDMTPSRTHGKPFDHLAELPGQYRGDWFNLVRFEFVRQEIELVKEQEIELYNIQKVFKKKSRELLRNTDRHSASQSSEPSKDFEKFDAKQLELAKSMKALRKESVASLKEVLLPLQLDRLREIDFRMKVKSQGIIATLKSDELSQQLGIDAEQVEEIEAKAKKLVEEYDLIMKSFKYDFEKQVISSLTRHQQDKLKGLMGPEYEVKASEGSSEFVEAGSMKEAALAKLKEIRERLPKAEK